MSQPNFTEQMYLCVAISVLLVLYVFLLVLDSPWSNHGCAWLQQDYSFSVLTEPMLTLVPEEEGLNPGRKLRKL